MKRLLLLTSVLLLTGCLNVVVNQQLHRDSTVDTAITFTADPFVLKGFENLTVNPELSDRFSYAENNGSVTYSFSRISVNSSLFKGSSGVFPGQTYTLEKRFFFLFYYYKYTIQLTGESSLSQFKGVANLTYVVKGFGSVSQTSGKKLDSSTVEFDVSPFESSTNTVEFRDFFITNWFSK